MKTYQRINSRNNNYAQRIELTFDLHHCTRTVLPVLRGSARRHKRYAAQLSAVIRNAIQFSQFSVLGGCIKSLFSMLLSVSVALSLAILLLLTILLL